MEDQYHDKLPPSILGTSPLNSPYDQPNCSKDLHSDKEEYKIPSYQPPKEDAKLSSGHEKKTKPAKKRKATQAATSTEAKIMKMETSIRKLNEHLSKRLVQRH